MSAVRRDVELRHRQQDDVQQSQPILWAQSLLEDAERVTSPEARDAILTRVGAVLLTRFGVTWDWNEMRRANDLWKAS